MGEKLRTARLKAGMTQTQLAEKIGCTQQEIARYEAGGREPRASMLKRLAEALGCMMEELV